jgi:tagaturonate reductase
MSTTPIVQFGTSRFLQAHADLFVSEALEQGTAPGPIAVVQSSGSAARASRLRALSDPQGVEIRIRGVEKDALIDTCQKVRSIARSLSLPGEVAEVREIIEKEAEIILSNTADAGYAPQDADSSTEFSAGMSYPAKLAWFLNRRYRAGGKPIQIMPCELVPKNGEVLRDLVCALAERYTPEFRDWLTSDVRWVNSLVDRIVSEALEPAGAVAEPYALWAIENQPGLVLPCKHAAVQVVEDLEQVETLKLFILNLGHTYLVSRWQNQTGEGKQFVREMMADPDDLADLEGLYRREVVPGFAAHGRREEAEAYVATTLDRFRNPFLDHRLADIAQNHAEKINRRIAAFLSWARTADASLVMPRLDALVSAQATGALHEA